MQQLNQDQLQELEEKYDSELQIRKLPHKLELACGIFLVLFAALFLPDPLVLYIVSIGGDPGGTFSLPAQIQAVENQGEGVGIVGGRAYQRPERA